LHSHLLGGFDNLMIVFLAPPSCVLLCKNCLALFHQHKLYRKEFEVEAG
jgi:hypothetical protein